MSSCRLAKSAISGLTWNDIEGTETGGNVARGG